ncbi:hypothetical protein L7F22_038775 [Adiantum nelumboides]|nr:hypothetical protein [Adiantum nelumboides]
MGCVSSKHLKKQAISDGWASPPSRSIPRPKTFTSSYSVERYQRHFVSLTSTSYGSLKVESPKHAEKTTVASLGDMYGMLRSLEEGNAAHSTKGMRNNVNKSPPHGHTGNCSASDRAVVAAPHVMPVNYIDRNSFNISQVMEPVDISPLNEMNMMHNNFPPSPIPGCPPMALDSSTEMNMNAAELGLSETINVREMMMGLEEAAPLLQDSSPAKRTHSNASTPRTKALQQQNQLHLKRKPDGSLKIVHVCTTKKGAADTYIQWNKEVSGAGKENQFPLYVHQIKKFPTKKGTFTESDCPLSQTSNASVKSTTPARNTCSLIPISQQAMIQAAQEIRPFRGDQSIGARKAVFERGSSFTSSQNDKSSPEISSASTASTRSVHYAPSINGKVRLTLQTDRNGSASIVHTPSPLSAKTMSRRRAYTGGFTCSELTSPTFDPELVASYEKVLSDVSQVEWDAAYVDSPKGHTFSSAETGITNVSSRPWLWSSMLMPIAQLDKRLYDPLECFQENCPPGGANAVVLYTTTLRGIRKTFEDCNTAREILQNFGLNIDERDVSMHLEFLNELRELMGRVASVPRMFIRGRYVGGIEEVVKLHEDGKLSELVEGLPKQLNGGNCDGCGGVRFVPCLDCRGSCKLRNENDDRIMRCPHCNENGLIQCPICT